ncbi:NlpC/P60 family protein [Nitratifractor sp.]
MKKYSILPLLCIALFVAGCGPRYDYTIHKPKVRYKHADRTKLRKLLEAQLGKPYVWAEEGPDAFDCSGLVYYCYESMNMKVPRVARNQAKVGRTVPRDKLQYGDLLFFDTTPRRTGQITHVGVYIGNGRFEHAANEKEGVKISSLSEPYYSKRLKLCKRYLPDENATGTFVPSVLLATKDTGSCSKTCFQVPKKVTAASGRYFIQVGSFRGKPDKAWLGHITAMGYDYRSVPGVDGMKRLLVGPFASRRDAEEVLPNARREFNPQAFIKEL